jgi:hypothetical protein
MAIALILVTIILSQIFLSRHSPAQEASRFGTGDGLLVAPPLTERIPDDTRSPQSGLGGDHPVALFSGGDERRIDARGQVVYRWTESGAEAYLIEGACRLATPDGLVSANQMLILVRPETNIKGDRAWGVRVAATGKVQFASENTKDAGQRIQTSFGESAWRGRWIVSIQPTVDAPNFRGAPDSRPLLMEVIAASSTESTKTGNATSVVTQAQYELPSPGDANLASPGDTVPGGLIETSPIPTEMLPRVQAMQPPSPRMPTAPGSVVGPDEPLMPAVQAPGSSPFQLILGGGSQSVEIVSRGAAQLAQLETQNRIETGETVVVARGGVTVLIRDVQAQLPTGQLLDLGTIELSADQVVGWFPIVTGLLSGSTSFNDAEGEFYLEGNIVFRQGDRVIYADSMYYNVTREYGMVLGAEAITSVPDFDGVVRLKADVLQQVASGEFIAFDAAVTSSRMGVPRYWLQSEQLRFSDQTRPGVDPTTGAPIELSNRVITSSNNFVYFGGVPLLYWPAFTSDVEVSSFYVNSVRYRNDSILGNQLYVDWDLFQLFGRQRPPDGVQWTLSTDYLSERGPALGTTLTYERDMFFGLAGPTRGFIDAWAIRDTGLDVLGRGRRDLQPEVTNRGRAIGRHRQYLAGDYELIGEIGYLSDRNFLDQYFEQEWDQDKDHDTNIRLRKHYYNNLFELSAEARLNDFYSETQRLPRLEHYLLGGSVLGDRLTWSMKNQVGYADTNIADPPIDPAQAAVTQTPLPGEANASGIIASTRQEVAMPLELGPIKFVPFVSGEASHYGEDINGESLTRLIGQAGVRSSLPMWRIDPNVHSSLLNVNGLAHKVELIGEYFYADSNTDFDQLPLYDRLDDNAQEEFRRRFIFDNFGGLLPDRFDPRTYALRHGMQRMVTNPSEVIADDLMQGRLGLHQRWQTKRGLPGRERIVDLMRFDVDTMIFPNADSDNFGETMGPTTYDFRYHVGDRVTLLSDGYADFFDSGLRSVSAGVRSSRPGLGEVYVGVMSLEGPITSQVLRTSYDYRMNEKWIVSANNTYDFGSAGNVGQNIALTRIGESFLLRIGLDIDRGRDNVGVSVLLEPRFFPSRRVGSIGGQLIPAAGLEGLE